MFNQKACKQVRIGSGLLRLLSKDMKKKQQQKIEINQKKIIKIKRK